MKKVVIIGGTGFIGSSVAGYLADHGFEPILVARNQPKRKLAYEFVQWDCSAGGAWSKCLEHAYAVVNLAGKSVDCIKTPDNCDLILRSRVDATRALGKALHGLDNPPRIWIQMSTAHIYGDPPVQVCTEDSSFGYGLATVVGKAWEQALSDTIPTGTREVRLRTSFVIGKNGGALVSLKRIVKMGLGGKVGHGQQGISWIHETDLNRLIHDAILEDKYSGAFIASSPHPVSNAFFMKQLRKVLRTPFGLSAPAWLTRIGAKLLFRTDPELVIYGRYVKSKRLEEIGFEFEFPHLDKALEDLFPR